MKNYSVIAATDSKWGLGKAGLIPWKYTEDFKWFKKVTEGSTCYMGRRTYDEIALLMKGKKELLPGRKCVVITRGDIDDSRVTVCNDLNRYQEYSTTNENFFIGGSEIYKFGLTVSDWVYITNVPGDFNCDVFFPKEILFENFQINRFIDLSEQLIVNIYERNALCD